MGGSSVSVSRRCATMLVAVLAACPLAGNGGPAATLTLPLAPKITAVYPQMQGATVFVSSQAPIQGHYVQYFTATSHPGGITATSNGSSNRIDIGGLTGGTVYTFTVTATNSDGTGPASPASASVTAGRYADYWIANGDPIGLNEDWSYYPGNAGKAVTWNATVTGVTPVRGTTVVQFEARTGGLYTLPYVRHSLIDSNGNRAGVGYGGGRFFLAPFAYLAVSVWPTQPGQQLGLRMYQTNALNGVLTQEDGPSTSRFRDSTQNWAANSLSGSGFSFLDLTTAHGSPVAGNTSNTMQTGVLPVVASAGDYYELSQPDYGVGNYVQVGNGENPSWGPARMTVGQWNTYRIPLSAFGNGSFPYGNQILKFVLQDQSGLPANTFYLTALGFTNH